MKNFVLLAFLFLFSATQLFAQGPTRYGFKIGVNVSQISSFEFDSFNVVTEQSAGTRLDTADDSRIGGSFVFFVEVPLNERLSFQPEFGYSQQGGNNSALRTNYLQLPLGLRLNFNKLFVMAGPQAGLKISDPDQSDYFESFDFSAFGAIGYHLSENFFLEARFTKGFSEIFTEDGRIAQPFPTENDMDGITLNEDNFLVNSTGTNTYFTVSIGYRL